MSLSSSPPADGAALSGDTETIPDRIVRVCSKCARPLSVGERMFYFLEAVNTPALCRVCVLDQERELAIPPPPPIDSAVPVVSVAPPPSPTSPPPPSGLPPRPRLVPTFPKEVAPPASEDSAASDPTGSLPSGARQLRLAASHYVDEGRLDEAIECIRELALEIGLLRSGPVPVPVPLHPEDSAPEDASAHYVMEPGYVSSISPFAPEDGPEEAHLAEGRPVGSTNTGRYRSDPV